MPRWPDYSFRAPSGGEPDHFFNLQLGLELRLLLVNRLLLVFRPSRCRLVELLIRPF